jgi:hypothetical protein
LCRIAGLQRKFVRRTAIIKGRIQTGLPAGTAGRKGWAGRTGDGAAIPAEASLEDILGEVARTLEACKEQRRAVVLEAPKAPE